VAKLVEGLFIGEGEFCVCTCYGGPVYFLDNFDRPSVSVSEVRFVLLSVVFEADLLFYVARDTSKVDLDVALCSWKDDVEGEIVRWMVILGFTKFVRVIVEFGIWRCLLFFLSYRSGRSRFRRLLLFLRGICGSGG